MNAICRIRPEESSDVRTVQLVELDAARRYSSVNETSFCVNLPSRDDIEHSHARELGLALVAEVENAIIGFILAMPVDYSAHILEVGVAREHQGCGYGRLLIAATETWAVRKGFDEITLTTFRDIAWNAPLYRRLGYHEFDVDPNRIELNAIIAEEIAAGFHQAPRVAMRKMLPK